LAGSDTALGAWVRGLALVLVVVVGAAPGARADTTAEVRVALSGPEKAPVAVSFGDGAVTLELPPGAVFPADFETESAGLLRSGRVTRSDDGRSRLELMLGAGLVERVSVGTDAVVLFIRSRGSAAAVTSAKAARDDAYKIGPEDKLQIAINGHPEMTLQAVVDKSGTVVAPLLGEVPAAGATVAELTGRITNLLSRDYLVDPKVDIQVTEYRSQSTVVTGEVRTPGRVALRGGTDLKAALAEVGGFGPDAGEDIEIARRSPDGAVSILHTDRGAFERGESNPSLVDGDLINVPRASFIFINGEVRVPGRIRVERGLTLLRAIALSGGFTEWANAKSVRVLRAGSAQRGEEHNVRDIEAGKAADPEVRGGDVVVVRRRFL